MARAINHRLLLTSSLSSLLFLFLFLYSCEARGLPPKSSSSRIADSNDRAVVHSPPPMPPTSLKPRIADAAINPICDKTDYPVLCVSSSKPYLINSDKIDATTILNAHLQATRDRIIAASRIALEKSREPKLIGFFVKTLQNCKSKYDEVLENLKEAEKDLKTHDLSTLNMMLFNNLFALNDCDTAFGDAKLKTIDGEQFYEPDGTPSGKLQPPVVPSPMAKEDDSLRSLTQNSIKIASFIN